MQKLADGAQLGAYTIVRRIGRGGMGEVYEAHESRLERRVALKVISPQKAGDYDDVDLVRRFLQEARTLAQINHPNVVTIYSIDRVAGTQFIAMEYVDGAILKDFFALFALSGDEAAPIFLQMLEGLRALHESRILHRDLKPHNLMLRSNGQVKILDFGIAKRLNDRNLDTTAVGVVIGTLSYLPPEVLKGVPANERSDLWSLGAIFYECLVGQPLIGNHSVKIKGVRASEESDVVFPHETLKWIPEEIRRIVGRLCDSQPSQRYVSAAEAIEDLRRFQLSRPTAPAHGAKAMQTALESMGELKQRLQKKMPKDSKAKRALWLAVGDGRSTPGNTEPIGMESKDLGIEELPPEYTQVTRDSVSARHRLKRRARRSREPLWSRALVPALLGAVLLLSGLLLRSYLMKPSLVKADVASTPQLLVPAEHQALWLRPGQVPTFSWSKIVNAGEYVLQVAWDPGFSTVVISEAVSGNSHRLDHPLNEGEYYWRLWPLSGGHAPQALQFSTAQLSAPELQQPPADQIFEAHEGKAVVHFAWGCKAGGTKYRLQLASDADFAHLLEEHLTAECAWPQALGEGSYFWRVQLEEPPPARGLWSSPRGLQVKAVRPVLPQAVVMPPPVVHAPPPVALPAAVSPPKRAAKVETTPPHLKNAKVSLQLQFKGKVATRDPASVRRQLVQYPTLHWSPLAEASGYDVQIARVPDFSRMVVSETVLKPSFEWQEVVPGHFFWRVKAHGVHKGFSEVGSLDVRLPAPGLSADVRVDKHGKWAWESVPLAERYLVQTAAERDLAGKSQVQTVEPEMNLKHESGAKFARVAAADASGEQVSDFSQVVKLEFTPAVPAPELKTPRSGVHVHLGKSGKITVIFSWAELAGVTGYEIQVAADSEFKNLLDQKALKTHHSVMREAELKGTVYWRVRGVDANGPGAWSEVSTLEAD